MRLAILTHVALATLSLAHLASAQVTPRPVTVVSPPMNLALVVQTASAGDVILVQPGTYPAPITVSQPIAIIAEQPNSVIAGPITIQDLNQEDRVQVRGIQFDRLFSGSQNCIRVDGACHVFFEDCQTSDTTGNDNEDPGMMTQQPTAVSSGSGSGIQYLTFVRCSLIGAPGRIVDSQDKGVSIATPGGVALLSEPGFGHGIALWDSTVIGGRGGDGVDMAVDASDGGAALVLNDTSLHLSGCTIGGGAGGDGMGISMPGCAPGNGGAAAIFNNVAGGHRDTNLTGGASGIPGVGSMCVPGLPGSASLAPLVALPGLGHSVRTPLNLIDNNTMQLQYTGETGAVYLTYAKDGSVFDHDLYPGTLGDLYISNFANLGPFDSGVVPGFSSPILINLNLPQSSAYLGVFQSGFQTTSGLYLGAPSILTVYR